MMVPYLITLDYPQLSYSLLFLTNCKHFGFLETLLNKQKKPLPQSGKSKLCIRVDTINSYCCSQISLGTR